MVSSGVDSSSVCSSVGSSSSVGSVLVTVLYVVGMGSSHVVVVVM